MTFIYAFISVPLGTAVSLMIALLLNQKIVGLGLWRTTMSVSGIACDPEGRPLQRQMLTLSRGSKGRELSGRVLTKTTTADGHFKFSELETAAQYVLTLHQDREVIRYAFTTPSQVTAQDLGTIVLRP